MDKECPCGEKYTVIYERDFTRKKYCSKKCFYKFRPKDSCKGLKYNIKKINPTWIKKGQRLSPETQFKKGHGWKGDNVGYSGIHDWVERELGKPRVCELCRTTRAKKYDWSNKSGTYKRDLSDWQRLCVRCHFYYDKHHFGTRENFHR